jgi:hypothetical protein
VGRQAYRIVSSWTGTERRRPLSRLPRSRETERWRATTGRSRQKFPPRSLTRALPLADSLTDGLVPSRAGELPRDGSIGRPPALPRQMGGPWFAPSEGSALPCREAGLGVGSVRTELRARRDSIPDASGCRGVQPGVDLKERSRRLLAWSGTLDRILPGPVDLDGFEPPGDPRQLLGGEPPDLVVVDRLGLVVVRVG